MDEFLNKRYPEPPCVCLWLRDSIKRGESRKPFAGMRIPCSLKSSPQSALGDLSDHGALGNSNREHRLGHLLLAPARSCACRIPTLSPEAISVSTIEGLTLLEFMCMGCHDAE